MRFLETCCAFVLLSCAGAATAELKIQTERFQAVWNRGALV